MVALQHVTRAPLALPAMAWIVNLILLLALPFLAHWLKAELTESARETTERALADYKAQHDRSLAEFGLYAQKRHYVYARLYGKYRIACDTYASLVGLTESRDFSETTREEAEDYCKQNKVPAHYSAPILAAYDNGYQQLASKLLSDLEHKLKMHRAGVFFVRAKNYEALNELYLSDDVIRQVDAVRQSIAKFSVHVPDDDVKGKDLYEMRLSMQGATNTLLQVMRNELRRGELPLNGPQVKVVENAETPPKE